MILAVFSNHTDSNSVLLKALFKHRAASLVLRWKLYFRSTFFGSFSWAESQELLGALIAISGHRCKELPLSRGAPPEAPNYYSCVTAVLFIMVHIWNYVAETHWLSSFRVLHIKAFNFQSRFWKHCVPTYPTLFFFIFMSFLLHFLSELLLWVRRDLHLVQLRTTKCNIMLYKANLSL